MTSDKTWRNRIMQQKPIMKNLPQDTPARQSLEEYLKSCSDNEYAEYIISTMHGSCPSEWDKAIKEAIEAIRSRQHTTAPAPIRSMREDEDGHISWQRMNEKALEEHDAQVAKAAREQVLDALRKEISDRFHLKPRPYDPNDQEIPQIGIDELAEIFDAAEESLRSQQGQPEQPLVPDPEKLQHFPFKQQEAGHE